MNHKGRGTNVNMSEIENHIATSEREELQGTKGKIQLRRTKNKNQGLQKKTTTPKN